MELIAVLIVVVFALGATLLLAIWLIVSAVSSKNRIAELTQRVDDLQIDVIRLRKSQTPPPPPAPAAAPKAEPAPAAAPAPPPEPTPVPVVEPEIVPVEIPPAPELPPATVPEPEAYTPAEQPLPPPPIIPPLPTPPPYIPPVIAPEPVAETMQASMGEETPPLAVPAPEKASFEMRLGTFWLVRVGIVMLLTGLAFFANYAYHHIIGKLGPAGKISLLYLASGLLLGAGAWWQRRNVKESLKNYAQVLFAGGLAAVYFTTYAAHYIPPLRVIESPLVDGILLLAWAGVIAFIADRRKSEVMALFAVGLAFYSSVITHVGEFTLYSNLILTVTAVVFLIRNRWATLSFASLVTSYTGYAFWRFLHPDGWHWAAANDETLTLGAGFLASYWLVFTAAIFLSRNDKLTGANRAAFLTLNNGAFFSLFLLTMLQTHTGKTWEFFLIYGSVLVALAGLAHKLLPAEPLTKNTYLTQGLVLVTLGFICKFAGLQLTLVLGAESVMLYIVGSLRKSLVLKFFAYASALLATAWCATSLKPFDEHGLWTALALGAFMAVNAFRAHWLESAKTPPSPRLETTAFTLLAFASWTAAAWFNTIAPHLPIVLVMGVESVVLYNLVAGRKNPVPKIFAYVITTLAVGFCVTNLSRFDPTGLWVGIALGALLIFNAWCAHREAANDAAPLRAEPSVFTLFAFAGWLATTWFNTTAEHLPLALAAEAVAFTFSIYALRVREITLLGQFFLIFAQFAWLFNFLTVTPPWWNPLAIIAVTIGLSHWWQHQKVLAISRNIFTCYSTIFALASVAVALVWLHPLVSAPTWLALTSLLAIATTAYGLITRAWTLAICGQIFLAVSACEFFRQAFGVKPEWFYPLVPIAALGILSFAAIGWFTRQPDSKAEVREPLLKIALAYRWIALLMSLVWLWDYVPERHQVWSYMAAAAAVFALAIWRRNREALVATTVYAVASLSVLWCHDYLVMDIYWPNLLSLLALFAMQQTLRRAAAKMPLNEYTHGAIVLVAGLSLWRFVTCWVPTSDLFLTMAWAGYAVLVFSAGMMLRERFYRWFGLAVLAASVGRVVIVDVWKQETIYRVLTFMALGVALLLIGFIYNKFQDTIRKWL